MVERILIGKHPDTAVMGMWISKATKNARTSTNTDDFLFDPAKALARPYVRGVIVNFTRGNLIQTRTTTLNGSTAYIRDYQWYFQFAHGLPYVPLFTTQAGKNIAQPACDAGVFYCLAYGNDALQFAIGDGYWSAPTGGTLLEATNTTRFYFDPATNKLVSKAPYQANFAIYRNKIA